MLTFIQIFHQNQFINECARKKKAYIRNYVKTELQSFCEM